MADPRRGARIAAILSVYALSCAGLYVALGGAVWLGVELLLTSAATAAAAVWRLRRLRSGAPMPRTVVLINVATGLVMAATVVALQQTGHRAVIVPAAVLVMADHFAPIAWAQRSLAPAPLGLALAAVGVFALSQGVATANRWAAGLSAAVFGLAALHQLVAARTAQSSTSQPRLS